MNGIDCCNGLNQTAIENEMYKKFQEAMKKQADVMAPYCQPQCSAQDRPASQIELAMQNLNDQRKILSEVAGRCCDKFRPVCTAAAENCVPAALMTGKDSDQVCTLEVQIREVTSDLFDICALLQNLISRCQL